MFCGVFPLIIGGGESSLSNKIVYVSGAWSARKLPEMPGNARSRSQGRASGPRRGVCASIALVGLGLYVVFS